MKKFFIPFIACFFIATVTTAQISRYVQNTSLTDKIIRHRNGNASVYITAIEPAANNLWLAAGTVYPDRNSGDGDYWLACTDSAGHIQWEKTWSAQGDDRVSCVIQTPDGGYILAGSSASAPGNDKTSTHFGMEDYWIIKLDSAREEEWQKTFGGSEGDELISIAVTENGYTVGGWSNSFNSGNTTMQPVTSVVGDYFNDYWVVELDKKGAIVSQRSLGQDVFCGLRQFHYLRDGGSLLVGMPKTDAFECSDDSGWMVRLDRNGDVLWKKRYAEPGFEFVLYNLFAEAPDGGFYLGGNTHTDEDYALMKFDRTGMPEWFRTYGGDEMENLQYLSPTRDNGVLLCGNSRSDSSKQKSQIAPGERMFDIWILKINASGEIERQHAWGGYDHEKMGQAIVLEDGSYVFAGSSISDSNYSKKENCYGGDDYWIAKCNPGGVPEWQKTIGGNKEDIATVLCATADGGFLIAGGSASGISGNKTVTAEGYAHNWLVKTDRNGIILWQKAFGAPRAHYIPMQLLESGPGNIYLVSSYGDPKYYEVFRLDADGNELVRFFVPREILLYALPVQFYNWRSPKMIIGNNQLVVNVFSTGDGQGMTGNAIMSCAVWEAVSNNLISR